MGAVPDTPQTEAIDRLVAEIDALQEVGVTPVDAADARRLIEGLEVAARRLRSVQVDLVGEIDRTAVHAVDGHASAKVMVRHVARLSGPEAHRRAQCARALSRLPEVRSAFRAGRIGGCQVERIARAHANARVRDAVEANEESFATEAAANSFEVFDRMVEEWVRLLDEDGTCDRDQSAHEKRDAALHQGFDGSWSLSGRCGSLPGVELHSILRAFLKAETALDWEKARAEHGDAATAADLPRTEAQRRFDALEEIFRRAAAHHATHGGSQIVTNLVMDHETFDRMLARLSGIDPTPVDEALSSFPTAKARCSTMDGHPVEPTAAVAHALLGDVRRVVLGSDSTVIDLGRRQRLFTGAAALAVKLGSTTCCWPGCLVPVTDCQCDHLTPWSTRADGSGGGCTCPGNGAPACGRHNRLKESGGYTTRRDGAGTLHVHRPDGTEIE